MYVRHGPPFTDRLIFHDMFNRAFHHVHDTNEGDDTSFRFYVWQLGYALFPWTGLAPLGLLWWLRRGTTDGGQPARRHVGAPRDVVPLRFRALLVHGDEVSPLHLPCRAAGRDADRRRARRHARRRRPRKAWGGLPAYLAGLTAGIALMVVGRRAYAGRVVPRREAGRASSRAPRQRVGVVLIVAGAAIVAMFVRAVPGEEPADASRGRRRGCACSRACWPRAR